MHLTRTQLSLHLLLQKQLLSTYLMLALAFGSLTICTAKDAIKSIVNELISESGSSQPAVATANNSAALKSPPELYCSDLLPSLQAAPSLETQAAAEPATPDETETVAD